MSSLPEATFLPNHFGVEPALLDQLSGRPGHQRCVVGDGELLLVAHEVPKPGIPEREALFFWKRRDGRWVGPTGRPGLGELDALLDRYASAIDGHAAVIDEADTAAEIFGMLRHVVPLTRCARNLVVTFEQTLSIDQDDREIRALGDRAREIERAAELLQADARLTLEFWQAERSEEQSRSADKLNRIVFRLNLLAGFFLPLVALGGLFGMNVALPFGTQTRAWFWVIITAGLVTGGIFLYYARSKAEHEAEKESRREKESL